MTTIINTPPSGENSDSGFGLVLGIIIAIVLVGLFFVYGFPAIRQSNNQPNNTDIITVPVPGATGATGATGPTGETGAEGKPAN